MTIHIDKDIEQGSDEWLAARCGVLTASTIGKLITVGIVGPDAYTCDDCGADSYQPCLSKASKVPKAISGYHSARTDVAAEVAAPLLSIARTDTANALLRTLAAERITGHVEPIPVSWDMQRGTDDEPFARDAYAEWAGVTVDEIGFAVREEEGANVTFKLGYSPDGLPGDDGLIEIKSRRQPRQVETILNDEVPAENLAQIHAGMWVMDRQWCDYISYRDGLHLYVKRVHRDPAWDLAVFGAAEYAERTIRQHVATYTKRVEGLPFVDKRPDLDDIQIGA